MTDNIVWTDVVEKAKAHFSEATFNAFWTKEMGLVDTLYLDVRFKDGTSKRYKLGIDEGGQGQVFALPINSN